ncbi:hypothetical protein J3R83DRAFT_7546 [Lanmaoa asiatica]|nr:hypothetical protein J3R83DRAFT_7546 [Lanmaoa asiatica]
MLRFSDKWQGRSHCVHIPVDAPLPDECVDYMAYTLVPWAWLVDLEPIAAQQALVRASNGTATWIEEWLGVRPNETLFLPDTESYEYQFVDTPAPVREGDKYIRTVSIDTLAATPQRLIQLGMLFGSSRLRTPAGGELTITGRGEAAHHVCEWDINIGCGEIGEVLGGTYVGARVRVGDGRFQVEARANVRLVWWKLVRDVLGLDIQTTLGLETREGHFFENRQGDGDEWGRLRQRRWR